jgi:hypothetical protein
MFGPIFNCKWPAKVLRDLFNPAFVPDPEFKHFDLKMLGSDRCETPVKATLSEALTKNSEKTAPKANRPAPWHISTPRQTRFGLEGFFMADQAELPLPEVLAYSNRGGSPHDSTTRIETNLFPDDFIALHRKRVCPETVFTLSSSKSSGIPPPLRYGATFPFADTP